MPGKYSHSLVIADYSTRGLINLPEDQRDHYLNTSAQYNGPRSAYDARLRGTQSAQGHRYRSSSLKSSLGSTTVHHVHTDGQTPTRLDGSVGRQDKRASQLYTLGGRSEPQLPIASGDSRFVADVPVPQIPQDIRRSFHQPQESAYERQSKRNAGTVTLDVGAGFQGSSQMHKKVDSVLNEMPAPVLPTFQSLDKKPSHIDVKQQNESSRTTERLTSSNSVKHSSKSLSSQNGMYSQVDNGVGPTGQVRKQKSLHLEPSNGSKHQDIGGSKVSMEQRQRDNQESRSQRSRPEPLRMDNLKPGNRSHPQGATDVAESSKTPRSNSSLSSMISNKAESPTAVARKTFSPKKAAYSPIEPAWRLPEIQEDHDFAHSMFEDSPMLTMRDKAMLSSIPEANVIGQISSGRDVSFENDDAASEMSAALPPPISRFRDEEAEFQANMVKFFGGDDGTVVSKTPSQVFKAGTKKSKGLFSRFRTKT